MDGLRIWKRAPFKLFFVYMVVTIVEVAIENIPWVGSWTLHIFVAGIMLYGVLLGLDDLAGGKPLRWSCLVAGFRHGRFLRSLTMAALCGFIIFGIAQLAVWAAFGNAGVDFMWLGHRVAHMALMTPRMQQIASVSASVPSVLLMLAPCVMLFDGQPPWRAFKRGVRMALRHAAPLAVFLLINVAIIWAASSMLWLIPVSLLFIPPWFLACNYAIWRDVRESSIQG